MNFKLKKILAHMNHEFNPLPAFASNERAEVGNLIDIALGLTLLLVLLGTVFAPVGLVTFAGVNRTAANIATGTTNGTIWDALVPLIFLALIVGVFNVVKKSYS